MNQVSKHHTSPPPSNARQRLTSDQMGGINLVIYYVPTVLEKSVGLTHNLSQLIGGAVNCMFFVGAIVPSLFLDRLGRRKPMMFGSFCLAICMLMISILLSFRFMPDKYSASLGKTTASASIAFFFIYMLIFGATANCVPWVYVPEILPLHARSKGTAVGISSNWLWVRFTTSRTFNKVGICGLMDLIEFLRRDDHAYDYR